MKVLPEFVVWNNPLSVDTQISPVTPGLTMTLNGEVDDPRVEVAANVLPPSVDKKNLEPDAP